MKAYHDVLAEVLETGEDRRDRTGVGTRSRFGFQMRFDLGRGFPLLTTKKTHFKSIAIELLWILKGDTNTRFLKENGVSIWDEWADENGNLGPVYGAQWRHWKNAQGQSIDQIAELVKNLKNNPSSRRHIVSAWNVGEIPNMALPPCHAFFQFHVSESKKLSCQLYQRSADLFLGVPFNIASYALLTHMLAEVLDLQVGDFVHTLGDAHIYHNHFEQVKTLLSREHRPLPQLKFARKVTALDDFQYSDFILENYDPHPGIKAPVAI